MINLCIIALIIWTVILLIVTGNVINNKVKRINYRNIYFSDGKNDFVFGLNEYHTKELAKRSQKCPPGYRWHSAICSRDWI